MMNKKTSYKRIVSLVLAVFMVASLLSVSAAADNKIININGELAVDGNTYESGAVVTIDTDDTVTVKVNGEEVALGENKAFTLTTETTDTADAAATNDEATPDTPDVPVEAGTVTITVYDVNGNVVAEVTVTVKPVADADESEDEATDDEATDDEATDDEATDDEATDDEATDDEATSDEATDDEAKNTDDEAKNTDDEAKNTEDEAKNTDDEATPDQGEKVKVLNGDVDGDGVITSNDALLILRYSIGLENFNKVQLAQGDLDNDGVYATDALTVLRASLGLETITPEYIEVEI